MKTDKDVSGIFELRKRAEIAMRDRREEGEELSSLSPEAKDNLIHELQVHQIELKMQNDELRRIQVKLEKTRDKYSHLYDFSPVGYVTLTEKGIIEEANLSVSSLIGVDRSALIGKPFTGCVLRGDQDIFYKLRHRLLETEKSQTCELRLVKKNGDEFFANLECMV